MSRPPQMPATAPTKAPAANTQIGAPCATATVPDTTRAITRTAATLTTTSPRGAVTACCLVTRYPATNEPRVPPRARGFARNRVPRSAS